MRQCALLRHVWPVNITAPIIIIYSITIGWAIIAEASLSFLGFGLSPDVPSSVSIATPAPAGWPSP